MASSDTTDPRRAWNEFLEKLETVRVEADAAAQSDPQPEVALSIHDLSKDQPTGRLLMNVRAQATQNISQVLNHPLRTVADIGVHLYNNARVGTVGPSMEELGDSPNFRQFLRDQGKDPDEYLLTQNLDARRKAWRNLTAFSAGVYAGGLTGSIARAAVASPLVTGIVGGGTFGGVEGLLKDLPEDQSRFGHAVAGAATTGTIGGLAAATLGTGAFALKNIRAQAGMVRQGIKPQLEAPEVAPGGPEFNPMADARAPLTAKAEAPIVSEVRQTPSTVLKPTRTILDPNRLLPRNNRDPVPLAEREARLAEARAEARRIRPEMQRLSVAELAGKQRALRKQIVAPTPISQRPAKPEVLGGTPEQLAEAEAARFHEGGQQIGEVLDRGRPPSALPTTRPSTALVPQEAGTPPGARVPPLGPPGTPPIGPPPPPGPGEVPYSDALNLMDQKISVGKSRRRGTRTMKETLDGMYTGLFDDVFPLNVAVQELLRNHDMAVARVKKAGGFVEQTQEAALIFDPALAQRLGLPGAKRLPGRRAIEGGEAILRLPGAFGGVGERPTYEAGYRLPGIVDPYVLARVQRGSVAQVLEMFETGVLNFYTLRPVTPGLREILKPISEEGLMRELLAFLFAPRSLDFAARGLVPPVPVNVATSILKNAPDEVVLAAERIFRQRDAALQYTADAGAVSPELATILTAAAPKYVSFARWFEDVEEPTPWVEEPHLKRPLSWFKFQRAKGGQKGVLMDPIETHMSNMAAMIAAANRQAALTALVALSEQSPGQQIVKFVKGVKPQLPNKTANDIAEEFAQVGIDLAPEQIEELGMFLQPTTVGAGRFYVFREGKKQFYEVEPELYNAIVAMRPRNIEGLWKLLSIPSAIFRAGVILDPGFSMMRNPLRDTQASAIYSRAGYIPLYDFAFGVFKAMNRSESYSNFLRDLGGHAGLLRALASDRKAAQKSMQHLIIENNPLREFTRLARTPAGNLEILAKMVDIVEAGSRVAEHDRVLAQTSDPRIAGFASREVTPIDFPKVGAWMHTARALAPFLGANLTGSAMFLKRFAFDPIKNPKKAFSWGPWVRALTYITMPTIALWLINALDEDYQELPTWRRDLYWNVPMGNGQFFPIPRPFEVGVIFGAGVERLLQWLLLNDPKFRALLEEMNIPGGGAFEGFGRNLLQQFNPLTMPPIIGAPIEAMSGYDFFLEREIVPESEKRLLAEYQAGPRQGETVRLLGKYLKWSPRKIENFIVGMTGGLGRNALATADQVLQMFTNVERPPEPGNVRDIVPIIGPMVSHVERSMKRPLLASRSVERFYNIWANVLATNATIRNLEQKGKLEEAALLTEVGFNDVVIYESLLDLSQQMSEIRRMITQISESDLPPEHREREKEQLGLMYRTLAATGVILWNNLQSAQASGSEYAPKPSSGAPGTTRQSREGLKPEGPP